jgi:hypothetical protein
MTIHIRVRGECNDNKAGTPYGIPVFTQTQVNTVILPNLMHQPADMPIIDAAHLVHRLC